MRRSIRKKQPAAAAGGDYSGLLGSVSELLDASRRASARAVNCFMTATYWEAGRRIVEFEQGGEKRAGYGEELLTRLAQDLSARFGRGFSRQNLQNMRQLYLSAPPDRIRQTLSGKLAESGIRQTVSGKSVKTTHSTLLLESSGSHIRATPSLVSPKKNRSSKARPSSASPSPWPTSPAPSRCPGQATSS